MLRLPYTFLDKPVTSPKLPNTNNPEKRCGHLIKIFTETLEYHKFEIILGENGGEGEIRTHEAFRPTAFRERHLQPLRHLSKICFANFGEASPFKNP